MPLPLKQKQRKCERKRNEKRSDDIEPQMFHFEPPVLYDHPDDGSVAADQKIISEAGGHRRICILPEKFPNGKSYRTV